MPLYQHFHGKKGRKKYLDQNDMKHQLQKSLRDIISVRESLACFKISAEMHKCRETSVADRHRFDADPDQDPNVHAGPAPC
jgi:hypothetical protein